MILFSFCSPDRSKDALILEELFSFKIQDPDRVLDVAVIDKMVYVANFINGVSIYDVTNSNRVALIKTIDSGICAQRLFLHDTLLFVSNRYDGLRVYSVKDPVNPYVISQYTETSSFGIFGDDNWAFSAGQQGLFVLDFTEKKEEAKIVCEIPQFNTSNQCLCENEFIYSANWYEGISIVDISDKSTPIVKSIIKTEDYSSELVKIGNYLVSANGKCGVMVFDVSDPSNVISTDSKTLGSEVLDISSDEKSLIFAGTLTDGIFILKLLHDGSLKLIDKYEKSGDSRGMFYSNGYLYIASQSTSTIKVLKIKEVH